MAYHDDDEEVDDRFDTSEADDAEAPDPSDRDDPDDDGGETIACPGCREPVYESAERCPHCGRYISEEDASRRYPLWLIAGVIICLLVVLLFWIR